MFWFNLMFLSCSIIFMHMLESDLHRESSCALIIKMYSTIQMKKVPAKCDIRILHRKNNLTVSCNRLQNMRGVFTGYFFGQ